MTHWRTFWHKVPEDLLGGESRECLAGIFRDSGRALATRRNL